MTHTDRTYLVVVTREGEDWLADVPELTGAHTFAHSLSGLDRSVHEVIVLAADLPDDAINDLHLDYSFATGDSVLDTTAATVRKLHARAESLSAEASESTSRAVRQLAAHGLGVRDTAAVLGISAQRVSKILAEPTIRVGRSMSAKPGNRSVSHLFIKSQPWFG
jgi:hypothetical protein